jgi:UPF0716 family protein affecting phage T7 exclusion
MSKKGRHGSGYYLAGLSAFLVLLVAASICFLATGDYLHFTHTALLLAFAAWAGSALLRVFLREKKKRNRKPNAKNA